MESLKLAAAAAIAVAELWCGAVPASAQGGQQFSSPGSGAQARGGDMRGDWRGNDRGPRRDWRGDDRDDRERGRRDRRRHGGYGSAFFGGFYYGGYDSLRAYDARDSGFFGDGDAVRTADGRVRYDYDRGYPYDFYRAQPAGGEGEVRRNRCSIERNVRVCRD